MRTSSAASSAATHDYFTEARRPVVSLLFLLPLLVAYEVGVWFFAASGEETVRSGADFWLRSGLSSIGLAQPVLLPVILVGVLLAWQRIGRHSWRVEPGTFVGMGAESLLFAFLLIVLGQLQDLAFQHAGSGPAALPAAAQGRVALAVAYIGAGVYEEVLFRLALLPLCYGLFRMSRIPRPWAASLAVLSTAAIFSLAHYVGPSADELTLFSCVFRTLAGVFFGTLFFVRGFGITVGCHAAYDLLVGLALGSA